MAEHRIKWKDLSAQGAGLQLRAGEQHVIVVLRDDAYFVEFADTLFRNNSAVLLPGTTSPSVDGVAHPGLDAVAVCLRYVDKNPGKKLLITAHTDTVGSDADNARLSRLRGQTVHGMLVGARDAFAEACWGPHLTGEQRYPASNDKKGVLWDDYTDVLQWVENSFGWPCSVARNHTLWQATCALQKSYNSDGHGGNPDASVPDLQVTGKFDKPTWAAVFDCYETQLAAILATDRAGLGSLRGKVAPVSAGHPFVGCGESHPLDQIGRDNYRSQTNRRVEVFFFDPGEEPDLPCLAAACAPQGCRLFDGMHYQRIPLPVDPNAVPGETGKIYMQILDPRTLDPLGGRSYQITGQQSGLTYDGATTAEGKLEHRLVPLDKYTLKLVGVAADFDVLLFEDDYPDPQIRFT